jgi:hypothetical protein
VPDGDYVCDSEVLYRSVPNQPGIHYVPISGGGYRVSRAAFEDRRKQQPSVDRAKLLDNDPEKCKKGPTHLVVSLTAARVRSIEGFSRTIDVVPAPNPPEDPDNLAHALITVDRPFDSNTQFDKFKKALAIVANSNWEIPPPNDG